MVMLTLLAHSIVSVAMDQHPDLLAQFVVQCRVPLPSLRDSPFFFLLHRCLPVVLTLSVVDASRCGLLWEGVDINIPFHVDRLSRDRSRGNSLVNVGLQH
jgi:hypothetical protein